MVNMLTKDNFAQEVLSADKPVVVDFWASWCGPCRMISPVVDQISDEYDTIKVCKVNVDEEPELAQQFGIMSIPTLLLFKDGKLADQIVGVRPKEDILCWAGLA